ncbi:hypothetical protein C2869_04860 [Saccharobesus litoralis]|uniref:Exo-alpha-sialidase n=1 Tax=Saccharobesus litoralis TaxID=2172099 RepID=A0A2S0VNZ7_9ALTE|nr:hypothetical protein [Saccharobesus litoralis]AWB65810.1 hypothetical protein C2869_04860 [Saccharobesus litoralis]
MQLISTKAISPFNQKHCAFTDLTCYAGRYFVCYRQAANHVSKDGEIIIQVSDDLVVWQTASVVRAVNTDLRDPKLSIDGQGRLILLYYRKQFAEDGRNIYNLPAVRFSSDGLSWSSERQLCDNNWWLWRLSYHPTKKNFALGVAYKRAENRVKLYAGDPLRQFECIEPDLFSQDRYGKGYPNESDIQFLADGTALCLLRRDADTGSVQLGTASAPYKKWQWLDLGYYLGGPTLLQLQDGRLIVGARIWSKKGGPKTALFELKLTKNNLAEYFASLDLLLVLPSAGDNSYPSLLERQGHLYVSYYSQHLSLQCRVYISKIKL